MNGLGNSLEVQASRDDVTAALRQMGLPAAVRGETLTLEQFAQLSNLLKEA